MFKLLVMLFALTTRKQALVKILVISTFFGHFAAFLHFRKMRRASIFRD